jgi:hypothetical protein
LVESAREAINAAFCRKRYADNKPATSSSELTCRRKWIRLGINSAAIYAPGLSKLELRQLFLGNKSRRTDMTEFSPDY